MDTLSLYELQVKESLWFAVISWSEVSFFFADKNVLKERREGNFIEGYLNKGNANDDLAKAEVEFGEANGNFVEANDDFEKANGNFVKTNGVLQPRLALVNRLA